MRTKLAAFVAAPLLALVLIFGGPAINSATDTAVLPAVESAAACDGFYVAYEWWENQGYWVDAWWPDGEGGYWQGSYWYDNWVHRSEWVYVGWC